MKRLEPLSQHDAARGGSNRIATLHRSHVPVDVVLRWRVAVALAPEEQPAFHPVTIRGNEPCRSRPRASWRVLPTRAQYGSGFQQTRRFHRRSTSRRARNAGRSLARRAAAPPRRAWGSHRYLRRGGWTERRSGCRPPRTTDPRHPRHVGSSDEAGHSESAEPRCRGFHRHCDRRRTRGFAHRARSQDSRSSPHPRSDA